MAGGGQEAHGRPAEPAGLSRRRGEGHEHHGARGGYQVMSQSSDPKFSNLAACPYSKIHNEQHIL